MVTFRYGLFSHLWIDMMQRMGLEVVVIEGRWGDGADEAKLEAILREDKEKKIKAVCVVQVGGLERQVLKRANPAAKETRGKNEEQTQQTQSQCTKGVRVSWRWLELHSCVFTV